MQPAPLDSQASLLHQSVTTLQLRLGSACMVSENLTTTVAIVQHGVAVRAKRTFIMHPTNLGPHQSVLL